MPKRFGMGWQRDLPDFRDYSPNTDKIQKLLKGSKALKSSRRAPSKIDLSQYCSPVEDQGNIGSCTAHAGIGLLEYYERRAFGDHIDASRLFVYKATRNLLGWTGDTGAWLRTTMKAMVLFGAPPERYMPYVEDDYDEEPSAFCYAFASAFKAINYFRLDSAGVVGDDLVKRVKQFLAAGYPSMFGFTVYNFGNDKGEIAFPSGSDPVLGGHAVIAIGYDDKRKIGDDTGALMIRNSWGENWGENGYGWLPYRYIEEGLADDFWSLFKADYVDTGKFD